MKNKTFIQGKVKPLQYGAKAVSIHKDSVKFKGDYFNFVIAGKKDGSGDYMYLDEFEPKAGGGTNDNKKVINTVKDFTSNDNESLPF
jgi:hypothetical protein